MTATRADAATATPVPRQRAAGADSARSLLFTVLGEFVLPAGEVAWTSTFIDVLGRLGVEEKASRQAVMRTADHGWLTAERVGRRTRWRLTDDARRLLVDGAERIFGFVGAATDWDGRWLVVNARVPETDRAARHHVRTRLAWAGLGSPAPGLWVSPHTDRIDEVEQVLRRAGVHDDARIFVGDYRGGGDLAQMVAQAWDLAAIDAEYRAFGERFARARAADPIVRTAELVHAWRRFPGIDPILPRDLLPRAWRGTRAAALFADRHRRWSGAAREQWQRLDGDPG